LSEIIRFHQNEVLQTHSTMTVKLKASKVAIEFPSNFSTKETDAKHCTGKISAAN